MGEPRLWALLAVFSLATLSIAACGDTDGGGKGEVPRQIVVGSSIPYPPFEQGRNGSYSGYDIDIVNEVAERIDAEVKYQDTAFGSIFRDLSQGKFDMVASATAITPEREKEVAFSQGYYETNQSLTVLKGSDIESVDDLSGKTVGGEKGTISISIATAGTDAAHVQTYGELDEVLNALRAGQVDAVIGDFNSSKDAVGAKPDLEIVQRDVAKEVYGLAFPIGTFEVKCSPPKLVSGDSASRLRFAVDGALSDMKRDGTLTELYEKWFEGKPPAGVLRPDFSGFC